MTTYHNIAAQIPDHVVSDYPMFVEFMKAYYEFMGQVGSPDDVIRNILEYRDIDATIGEFKDHIISEFMGSIPENILADKALLAKHIKELYVSKGTEASYRMLFRILFNKEIDVNYPSDQILKLSDGKWSQNISFAAHISNLYTPAEILTAIGQKILVTIGDKSLPVSVLDIVQLQTTDPTYNLYEFFINKDFYDDFSTATTFTCNTIGLIRIIGGGTGYTDTDIVAASSIDGSGANIKITTTNGVVSGVTLLSGGIGYIDAPSINITSAKGVGAYLSPVISQIFSGEILPSIYKPSVLQAPSGYIEGKVYPLVDSTGSEGYIQIKRNANGVVKTVTVAAFGKYYQPTMYAVIDRDNAVPKATAVISGGKVIGVNIVFGGLAYSLPTPIPTWTSITPQPANLVRGTITNIGDNRILLSGGTDGTTISAAEYIGRVYTNHIEWDITSPLLVPMINHMAGVLPDGRVLLAGGHDATTGEITKNTYFGTVVGDAITWVAGTQLPAFMVYSTLSVLADGRILVVGGTDGTTISSSCYLGTITGNTIVWVSTNPALASMINHMASVLPDGRVLLAGGHDATTGEITKNTYFGTVAGDVTTWVAGTQLPAFILYGTLNTLPDGRILVVGGTSGTVVSNNTYIGNITGNAIAWDIGNTLPAPKMQHNSVTLSSSGVISLGGYTNPDISPDITGSVYISTEFSTAIGVLGNGYGAKIFAVISNGAVIDTIISDGGYGYTVPPALVFSPTSLVLLIQNNKLRTYNGSYLSTDGFSSADMVVYDGRFYQKYSYEIVISELFDTYRGVLKKLLHPAGYAVWGVYDMQKFLQVDITSEKIGVERSAIFLDIVYYVESLIFTIQKSIAESVTVTEATAFAMTKPLSEGVTVADTVVRSIETARAETVTTSDVVVKTINKASTDSVSISLGDINNRYVAGDYFAADYNSYKELNFAIAKAMADAVTPTDSFAWVLN
jgi:Ni,Fe-hydrogenase III small subunit